MTSCKNDRYLHKVNKFGEILSDSSLYTTSILALLADRFGTEFFEWDPLTVDMELQVEAGIQPSPALLDKIQAGVSLFSTNLFFVSLETFGITCNTLNFGVTSSNIMVPADLDDVLWGVTEASILLGPEMYSKDEFSHNVAKYVGMLLSQDGIIKPPRMLDFAEIDKDLNIRADAAFDDDDTMREAYWRNQEMDNKMLDKVNYAKIMSLMTQLTKLPLEHGNPEFVTSTLQRLKGAAA